MIRNGTHSCAVCHIDGNRDELAWSDTKPCLVLEYTDSLSAPNWLPVTASRFTSGGFVLVPDAGAGLQRFYRSRQP